ncbi:glycosyltransferase, partial [Streptomyces atacamensis]|uniref:glycosyltransferase n=1 Tax=Streptomyces atacamensis TaxID=531966 RepID=UPI00399D0D74
PPTGSRRPDGTRRRTSAARCACWWTGPRCSATWPAPGGSATLRTCSRCPCGTGGLPELVGDAALLVPYGDAEALADAVGGLLVDPARRRGLAAAGRAQAATWPSEDETVTQVLSVYDELAQGG